MPHRRQFLRTALLTACGGSGSGWLPQLAQALTTDASRRRHCILLWMNGGPSQMDTFDLKPGHANGGEFKEIETSAAGLRISEHLPRLAAQGQHLAVLRGLSTKEGDHGRGTYLMRTGHVPGGPVRYPGIGASLAKELGDDEAELPPYISIAPFQQFNQAAYGPGFLGPKYAPAVVEARRSARPTSDGNEADATPQPTGYADLRFENLLPTEASAARLSERMALWQGLESEFLATHRASSAVGHEMVYRRALRMMRSPAAGAFDLSSEPTTVRDKYGSGVFGQGCLLARRLIEQGVGSVEVNLGDFTGANGNWDTHQNNFTGVKELSAQLDAGWSSLIEDLAERGLLELTTILWMGEFGRTPVMTPTAGRGHWTNCMSMIVAGGGLPCGQVIGSTDRRGYDITAAPVRPADLAATVFRHLDIDLGAQWVNRQGRPIPIVTEDGQPIPGLC